MLVFATLILVEGEQSLGDEILESSNPGCGLVAAERIPKEELGVLHIQPKECPVVGLADTRASVVAVAWSVAGAVIVAVASIFAAIVIVATAAIALLAVPDLHRKNAQNVGKGLDVECPRAMVVRVIIIAGNIDGEINRKDENVAAGVVHAVERIKTCLEAINIKPSLISETGSGRDGHLS